MIYIQTLDFPPNTTNKNLKKLLTILLCILAFLNITVGVFQYFIHSSGDLFNIFHYGYRFFNSPTDFTIFNEIVSRYPINSLIVISPLFGFYTSKILTKAIYIVQLLSFLVLIPVLFSKLFVKQKNKIFLVLCLFLACSSVRASMNVGQIGIILFGYFLVSWNFATNKKWTLSGILLSIAIVKPQIGLFYVVFFLFQRHFKPVLISIAIHTTIYTSACLYTNINILDSLKCYFNWQKIAMLAEPGLYHSPDIGQFLKIFFDTSNQTNFIVCLSILTLSTVLAFLKRNEPEKCLALLTVSSLLVIYHRPYDLFLIIPVIPLIISKNCTTIDSVYKGIMLCLLIVPYFMTFRFMSEYTYFLKISYQIYVGLLVLTVVSIYKISPDVTLNIENKSLKL